MGHCLRFWWHHKLMFLYIYSFKYLFIYSITLGDLLKLEQLNTETQKLGIWISILFLRLEENT